MKIKNKNMKALLKEIFYFTLILSILFSPSSSAILASEASSTNYRITDLNSGDLMNSTGYRVTGSFSESTSGFWASNAIPLAPGVITSCGKMNTSGTYILSSDLNGYSSQCLSAEADSVVVEGGGHTLTGSIIANNHGVTLVNININGDVTVTGATSTLLLNSSSTILGSLTIGGILGGDGSGSAASTTIAVGGSVATSSIIFTAGVVNNGIINSGNPIPGRIINNSIINGDFTFNTTSINNGTVNGNATMKDSSVNLGTINGDIIFYNILASSGVATFTGNSTFTGTNIVTGNIKDRIGSIITKWAFNDQSINSGYTRGNVFFNDTSSNTGTVYGHAYFNNLSTNIGTTTGDADVYNAVTTALGGSVSGTITYHSYPNTVSFRNISGDYSWNNLSNWFIDTVSASPLGRTPVTGEDIVLFASSTLPSDIVNNIYIAVGSTTISGAGHTITGNIYGNGAYGGNNAYNFDLKNITVMGTTTASGGDGTPTVNGGMGGNVYVATSSTGAIVVNGGDPQQNGGDAGSVTVTNSFAIQDGTPIYAIGGDSSGCGYGGSGGNISLINSSGYVMSTEPGKDATTTISFGGYCVDPPYGGSGRSGTRIVIGTYTPQSSSNTNLGNNNPGNGMFSGFAFINMPWYLNLLGIKKFDTFNSTDFGVTKLGNLLAGLLPTNALNLSPTVAFEFVSSMSKFLFTYTSSSIKNIRENTPKLAEYLKLEKINSQQDLAKIYNVPIKLTPPKDFIPGLFRVNISGKILDTYVSSDSKNSVVELVKVKSNDILNISFLPTSKGDVTGEFNGKTITFRSAPVGEVFASLTAPEKPGRYLLKTEYSTIPLAIDVTAVIVPQNPIKTKWYTGVINWFKNIF